MNDWIAKRLQSAWLYRGADVMRLRTITPSQKNYALTLRRQLVERLKRKAVSVAVLNPTPEGREWSYIAEACRRELRRTERALQRLASANPPPTFTAEQLAQAEQAGFRG